MAVGVEPIDRTEHITDNILGTRIHGDAHTTGTVGVATIPSADTAVLEFMSQGNSQSQNVGRNGPAVIRSTAHTDFIATKRVELSDAVFASLPAMRDADDEVRYSLDREARRRSRKPNCLQGRLAACRQSHGRADSIASDHAEDRIERRFNHDVNDELRDARKRYDDEFAGP